MEEVNSQTENTEVTYTIRDSVARDDVREKIEAEIDNSLPNTVAAEVIPSDIDPALLLVKGKSGENKQYIKSLAHAIMTVLARHGYATLKCVGAASVNNGVKSFTIASGEAKVRGINLVLTSGFQNAMFADVEKTAIVMKIFDR